MIYFSSHSGPDTVLAIRYTKVSVLSGVTDQAPRVRWTESGLCHLLQLHLCFPIDKMDHGIKESWSVSTETSENGKDTVSNRCLMGW